MYNGDMKIDNIQIKKFFGRYIYTVMLVVLFYFMILNMIKSTEQVAGIPREMYFSRSMLFFFAMIIILRRISWKRFEVWGTIIVGAIGLAIYYYIKGINWISYGSRGFRVVGYRHMYVVVSIALLLETFFRWKKNGIPKNWNFPVMAVFSAGVVIAGIMERSTIIPLLYVSVAILLTDIDKDEWLRLVDYFAIGYYLVFVWMMTLSLTVYSNNIQSGRLIGAFLQVETAGMFVGGAIVCALYFIYRMLYNTRIKWYKILFCTLTIGYPILGLIKISSRSTIIGILFSVFILFIIFGRDKKSKIIRTAICSGCFLLFIFSVFLFISYILKYADESTVDTTKSYSYFVLKIISIRDKFERHRYGFGGYFLTTANMISSNRLKIYYESIKQIGFVGHAFQAITVSRDYITTPHNFYILSLINYGWIGGGLIILWFIMYLGSAVKRSIARDKTAVLATLWICFCVVNFLFTCETWASPVYFGMLFLQYPLVRYKNFYK